MTNWPRYASEDLPPAVKNALNRWLDRQWRWRNDEPEIPGAYAKELQAFADCTEEEFDLLCSEIQRMARMMITELELLSFMHG